MQRALNKCSTYLTLMLTKRIIPCLDVKYGDGNRALVVKGIEFVSLRAAGDPVELAKRHDHEAHNCENRA